MVDAAGVRPGVGEARPDRFGSSVTVTGEQLTDRISTTAIEPARPGAVEVSWVLMSDQEIIVNVGEGGCWEVSQEPHDVAFVRDLVLSVAAGRVQESFGPGRSHRLEVTMADGTVEAQARHGGLSGCFPLPRWRRRGAVRRVVHAPW